MCQKICKNSIKKCYQKIVFTNNIYLIYDVKKGVDIK